MYHELNVGISKIGFLDISPETLYCLKDTNVSFKSTQFDRVSSQKDKLICQTDWQQGIAEAQSAKLPLPVKHFWFDKKL